MSSAGYFRFPRELFTSDLWKDLSYEYRHIFMTILNYAAFKPTTQNDHGHIIDIKPGQFLTTYRDLVRLCDDENIDKSKIERALTRFEKCGFSRQETRHVKTLITITEPNICKYLEKENETRNENKTRQDRDKIETQKNNDNKENKENKYINDSESVTFQEEEVVEEIARKVEIPPKEDAKEPTVVVKTEIAKQPESSLAPSCQTLHQKKNSPPDWKASFTVEERKFLAFLLSIIPAVGDRIKEEHATWWIKSFGIDKIKVALQVYQQQVEKAKKDTKVPVPKNIGAYMRDALNKGTRPCRDSDRRNKAFSEQFKKQAGWSGLTITEKYCRAEELGKEWYFNLPETLFQESIRTTFENCYGGMDRKCSVA